MTVPTTDRNLLDLHMPIDPNGSVSAMAPLAWCVTKRLMSEVEGFVNPHLLIVNRTSRTVTYGNIKDTEYTDKWVRVVPLANAMQYLSFSSPGENELHVYVVDLDTKYEIAAVREFANNVRHNSEMSYEMTHINEDGTLKELQGLRFMKKKSEMLVVDVPAEMFAPPPAEWRRKTVQKFFGRSKAVDQCHFRKRFWFISLPLAIFLVPLLYISKAVFTAIAYSIGFRGYRLETFKHPLENLPELWNVSYNGIWLAPVEDSKRNTRVSIWSLLNFFALAIIFFVGILFNAVGWGRTGLILLAAAVLAVAAYAIIRLATGPTLRELWERWEKRRDEAERKRARQTLELITCEMNLPANSVRELPKELRTVNLRFNDFKTKVCRPFAR